MERRAAFFSGVLHAGLITAAMLGLPDLWDAKTVENPPILVDLMELSDKTASPPPKPMPEPPKPEPPKPAPPRPAAAEPPKPPPPQPVAEAPKPPPEPPKPAPPPEEKVAALPPPEPKPPVAAPKPEPPKPAPVPAQKPEPPRPKAEEKKPDDKKPAPPDNFASVLKTVDTLRRPTPAPSEARASESERTSPRAPLSLDQRLTISDFDSIRRQFEACWSPPAGAKDAKNLAVMIKVKMNPDGTVQSAEFAETLRFNSDPFYRAAAESAMRAVLNRRCQPIKAPPDKYAGSSGWNALMINFDPKELIGP